MKNALAIVFFLATASPGLLFVILLLTGNPVRLDGGVACAVAWLFVGTLLLVQGVRRGMRQAEREDRQRRGRCVGCGYDLRGASERCPECGRLNARRRRFSRPIIRSRQDGNNNPPAGQ